MGGNKKIVLIDIKAITEKVMLEVNQLTINKGDYVLITIAEGLEYIGKYLLKDINKALPGVFVTLTFAGVEVETKKLDDLEGQEDE